MYSKIDCRASALVGYTPVTHSLFSVAKKLSITEVTELVARYLPCAVQAVFAKPQPRLPSILRLSSADTAGRQIAAGTSAVVQVKALFVSARRDTGNNPFVHQTHYKIEKPIQSSRTL
jgi:hypothetical protein